MHALLLAALTLAAPRPSDGAGDLLLVLHKSENTLGLYDPETGERVHTSPTGPGPHEAAVDPTGRLAVVCDYGHRDPGSTLTVFDCVAREVLRTIDLGEFRRPHGIEFAPDGKTVLVTAEQNRAVVRVDPHAGRVMGSIPTEQNASHMLVHAVAGERAFVANISSNSVSVLDLAAGELLKVVATGAGSEGLDVTPDGAELWVGNRGADTLSILSCESLAVVDTVACGSFPIRLKITLDGKHALVSNAQSGEIAVFEVATRKELKRISMGFDAKSDTEERLFGDRFGRSPVPVGILLDPGGKRAFVANAGADLVTVLDLESWTVSGRIVTGKEPDGMAWVPAAPSGD